MSEAPADDPLAAAHACFRGGDLSGALAWLGTLDEADPRYGAARLLAGNVYLAGRDYPAAEAAYQDAIARAPDNAETWNNLGNLLAVSGRPDEARPAFERASRLAPGSADALVNLGTLADLAGDRESALRRYREAVAAEPGSAIACQALAGALSRAGRGAEAVAELRALTAAQPGEASAFHALATLLAAQGELAPAAEALGRVLALAPEMRGVHGALSECLLHLGQFQQAVPHLEAALGEEPDSAPLTTNYGVAAATLGDIVTARGAFARALEIDAAYFPASLNLSRLALMGGDREGAVVVARVATRADPDSREARRHLAGLLLECGRFLEAEAVVNDAVAAFPADPELGNLQGVIAQRSGRLGEARACFERVAAMAPEHAGTQLNLIQTHLAAGDVAQAYETARATVERFPAVSFAHALLGHSARLHGKHEAALSAFEEALRIDPQNLFSWDELVGLLRDLGRTREMIGAYRRARAAHPSFDTRTYRNLAAVDIDA